MQYSVVVEGRELRGADGISRFAKVERVKLHATGEARRRVPRAMLGAESAIDFFLGYIRRHLPDPFFLLQATLRTFSSPLQSQKQEILLFLLF